MAARKRGKSDELKFTDLEACNDCPAMCCHDLTIDIKKPRTNYDLGVLMWKLNYENIGIYIRNRRWHMIVKSKCQYLGEDNLCTIYEKRDDICRNHMPPNCERFGEWYDVMFTTPYELEAHIKAERKGKKPPKPKGTWKSKGA